MDNPPAFQINTTPNPKLSSLQPPNPSLYKRPKRKSCFSLKSLDTLVPPIGFHWNNKDNFQTKCGGLCKIAFIALMSLFTVHYMQEFWYCRNPNLVSNIGEYYTNFFDFLTKFSLGNWW